MEFSLWPNMNRPTDEVLDLARLADEGGWFGVWYADHYMPNTGSEAFAPGDVHECWAMLAAIAVVTSRIRVGPLVAPTSVHHPALLANRAATIDHLSHGRFVLGLGAGWQINEHAAYGIELEPPGARVDRFEEAIQIVRALLDEDRTTFEGEVFRVTDAPADPKPVQDQLPILVGTGSPRMLRITARHAQEWNAWGAPQLAAERRDAFVGACEATGIDPASKWMSVQALVVPTDDSDELARIRSGDMAARAIAGSDAELVDQLGRYAELGFDEFVVPDWFLGDTREERFDTLHRLQEDVLPNVRR